MTGRSCGRRRLPFREVNRRGTPGHDPGLQRHHLLPRQLLSARAFGQMFEAIGQAELGFEDFRSNGLLLPAREEAAIRLSLPLHRGPHRTYNAMVMERVGGVEQAWAKTRARSPDQAAQDALFRLRLLQGALRSRLLSHERRPLLLNRRDPLGSGFDFTELDAMAERLWESTQNIAAVSASFAS